MKRDSDDDKWDRPDSIGAWGRLLTAGVVRGDELRAAGHPHAAVVAPEALLLRVEIELHDGGQRIALLLPVAGLLATAGQEIDKAIARHDMARLGT